MKTQGHVNAPSLNRQRGYHGTSAQTGAFQFIPVPFLDDWLIARWRRRLVRQLLKEQGIRFESKVPRILTRWANRSLFARMRSTTTGLLMKPLRKVFRTVLIWLTARNAARTTAETYFLGRFLQHPSLTARFSHQLLTNKEAEHLAEVFATVVEKIDQRVAGQAAKKIWNTLRARIKSDDQDGLDTDDVGQVMNQEAPGILADFDDRVSRLLKDS